MSFRTFIARLLGMDERSGMSTSDTDPDSAFRAAQAAQASNWSTGEPSQEERAAQQMALARGVTWRQEAAERLNAMAGVSIPEGMGIDRSPSPYWQGALGELLTGNAQPSKPPSSGPGWNVPRPGLLQHALAGEIGTKRTVTLLTLCTRCPYRPPS